MLNSLEGTNLEFDYEVKGLLGALTHPDITNIVKNFNSEDFELFAFYVCSVIQPEKLSNIFRSCEYYKAIKNDLNDDIEI